MNKLIYGKGNSESTRYYRNGQIYNIWYNMIKRCYSNHSCYTAYNDCTVDEKWLLFDNFADWFKLNYVNDWQLDKDILIKGNKIYGPDTCCFVPHEINYLILTNKSRRGNLPIGIKKVGNKFSVYVSKYKNKIYLGTFLTIEEAFNIYKIAKENHIKDVIETYKNLLNIDVYNTLYNWNIEITD